MASSEIAESEWSSLPRDTWTVLRPLALPGLADRTVESEDVVGVGTATEISPMRRPLREEQSAAQVSKRVHPAAVLLTTVHYGLSMLGAADALRLHATRIRVNVHSLFGFDAGCQSGKILGPGVAAAVNK